MEINNIIVIVHLLVRSKKDEPLLNLYLSDTGCRAQKIDNREVKIDSRAGEKRDKELLYEFLNGKRLDLKYGSDMDSEEIKR